MQNAVKTTHNLDFEVAKYRYSEDILQFRVGTCKGLWFSDEESYRILAIINSSPHNGHLDDVFEWFEYSCRRDKKALCIMELFNKDFRRHLIEKRGFKPNGNGVIKQF
jgi:hypothetical protein